MSYKIKIIAVGIFALVFFSLGTAARAGCIWQTTCDSNHPLVPVGDNGDSSCGVSSTKPANAKCCCTMPDAVPNSSGSNADSLPWCNWREPSGGNPCGAIGAETVYGQNGFCPHASPLARPDNTANCCCPSSGNVLVTEKPAAVLNNPFEKLNVQIPGLYQNIGCKKNDDGSYSCPKVNCDDDGNGNTACVIPWIGQYIIAVFNYALIIIGVLSAVTIMAGGVLWLISGTNASRMKTAKELIIGSVSGLVIMFSTYMIIYIVNPDILLFKPISLTYIEEYAPDDSDSSKDGSPSAYRSACLDFKSDGSTSSCTALIGKEPANLVTTFGSGNKRMTKDMADKLTAALKCVKDKNGKDLFSVSAAVRTAEVSMRLYNNYKKNPQSSNVAAAPCCSMHMNGDAVDLGRNDGVNWFAHQKTKAEQTAFIQKQWDYVKSVGLVDCMHNAGVPGGFVPTEPWHWSLTGH